MRDDKARFEKAGAAILGVNSAGPAAHAAYCATFGFGFPILADEKLEMSKAYGAEKGGGVRRTVVLVGPDGIIKFHKYGMPTDDEILAALK